MEGRMPYATIDDLSAAFGLQEVAQITQRETGQLGVIDETVAGVALEAASREVDSRIGARYATPLAVVPALIVAACCDLARWRLYRHSIPETVGERYAAAVRWLDAVGAGRAVLLADDGSIITQASEEVAAATSPVAASARTLDYGDSFRSAYAPSFERTGIVP
jgi:phage gp36-like protein